ncbi:glycosyltransferase family 4 protein [Salipaludibacillus daqingensis]|uniref:glycosyltransferase family 4 protein n=1 Tax=Salipaludibacillus daqingensis TaxID=3041001 RepID=UPI0024759C13|nr:glycosyltransferase family 4 protein [Salipaludibacillus daqingensis]
MVKINRSAKSMMFIVSSLANGGAQRVISELANYYADNDITIHILLLSSDDIFFKINKKVNIIPVCNEISKKAGLSAMISRWKLIRKYAKQLKPSVVISFLSVTNIYTCFALGFTDHKVIVSERNDPRHDPKSVIKRRVREWAYRLADGLVFQTEDAQHYFDKVIQDKSIVIPNPIKGDLPEPFMGERTKKIIAIGRLEKQKNLPLLIESFHIFHRENADYILDIYGEGTERDPLEQLIKHFGLEDKITLKGNVTNIHQSILDASFFVMSSDYEGMPNALMEAMALGLACISTDCPCGGPASLITDEENGLLIPPDNKEALIHAMKRVSRDTHLRKKISLNAIKINNGKYALPQIANQWLEFNESISKTDLGELYEHIKTN